MKFFMKTNERVTVIVLLGLNVLLAAHDVMEDFDEGQSRFHLSLEFVSIFLTVAMIAYLVFLIMRLKRSEEVLHQNSAHWQQQAKQWNEKASSLARGLSQLVDEQLESWKFSGAEKEVALLVLKGRSVKEIAQLRSTSEHTVKQQTISIYRKSGISGRAELAAFFLDEVFLARSG